MLDELNQDKNFVYIAYPDSILSVFDHTNYDRSDLEILSVPQRKYTERKLKKFGYKFKTGRVLISKDYSQKFRIPKQSIISSNPYDILRYEKRDDGDIYILTPTQAACYILTHYESVELLQRLKSLIEKQPVNLKKIYDHSRFEKTKDSYYRIYRELQNYQDDLVKNSKLKYKNHLGKFF